MSLQDRLSSDLFNKLNEMKMNLPKESFSLEESVKEEDEIRQELLKQAALEEQSDEIDDDFLTSLSGPSQESGNETLVEVEYLGRVGLVDISFENLDQELTEQEYLVILDSLNIMSTSSDSSSRKNAAKKIEEYGERAITVIFRECRQFDLASQESKNELLHLLSRLTIRSYKGRKLVKAIVERANSKQHISLAIQCAGAVREREAVSSILTHMRNPDYFGHGLDALLKIRDKNSVEPLIQLMNNLDVNRTEMIEQGIQQARRFADFGPDAIKPIFHAYMNCEKKPIRPIFTIALRSFQEEAVPFLAEVLAKETDYDQLVPVCLNLGGMRTAVSTQVLVDALDKYPEKKQALILGISHTNDESLVPLIVQELNKTSDAIIQKECLTAIGYLSGRDANLFPVIKPYLHDRKNNLYLDALNCMVRLGDQDSFAKFVDLLMNGEEREQYILQKHLSRMPFPLLEKMAEKILVIPDDKAILLVSALQRSNLLPTGVGRTLLKKLEQNPMTALRIEIYRLIGKHVGKKSAIVSQDVLYKARREETSPMVIRELDQIIKFMRKNVGVLQDTK
ncbi:HEAT repeat domain-containing protein [Bacillus niameyensis]|uniref:HEAT repeat domain-containing protein n=1 Tax=Bacillus niameyensis TaxID=1522308 RepID=UPI0007867E8A|nr:hypothetical protein [Bacillus niameyensis]